MLGGSAANRRGIAGAGASGGDCATAVGSLVSAPIAGIRGRWGGVTGIMLASGLVEVYAVPF